MFGSFDSFFTDEVLSVAKNPNDGDVSHFREKFLPTAFSCPSI